ncbi:hypothetical protein [Bacillus sp. 03113]|uniref:hypothetical protein n=1 Tax=Bacillus sp. 03113 TaxID=2578211 RepID=UPI001144D9C1|nr:hypothetical protein [Bacillus sp. 03113]
MTLTYPVEQRSQYYKWDNIEVQIQSPRKSENYSKNIGLKKGILGNTEKYKYEYNNGLVIYSSRENTLTITEEFPKRGYDSGTKLLRKGVGQGVSKFDKSHIQNGQHKNDLNKIHWFRLLELENYISDQLKEKSILHFGNVVITTKDRYSQLTSYEKAIDDAIDEIMYQTAIERQNDSVEIDIVDVINELELDANEILEILNELEDENE